MGSTLWLMGCAHYGERAHNSRLFGKYLEWAKKHNSDIAILGDALDTGTCFGTKHVGSVWENGKTPQEQIDGFVKLIEPVKSQILVMISGNHEKRIEQVSSINPLRQVADRLGVGFSSTNHVLRWNGLNIFVAHGASSGEGDFNKLSRAYEGIDVFALAHTHQLEQKVKRKYVVNGHAAVKDKTVLWVRCGNFLTDANYAKFALHEPTPTGSPILGLIDGTPTIQLGLGGH